MSDRIKAALAVATVMYLLTAALLDHRVHPEQGVPDHG